MAYEIPGFSFTLPAGADFSAAKQFRFVNVDSSGNAVNPSAGGAVVGVRQNTPTLGDGCTIVQSGIVFVEVGTGGLTAGGNVASSATGTAIAPATGNLIVGRALETGAAGTQIAVLLTPAAAASA